jgi:hypothetical protein
MAVSEELCVMDQALPHNGLSRQFLEVKGLSVWRFLMLLNCGRLMSPAGFSQVLLGYLSSKPLSWPPCHEACPACILLGFVCLFVCRLILVATVTILRDAVTHLVFARRSRTLGGVIEASKVAY